MPGGRPTACTPDVIDKMRQALTGGAYFEVACEFCDIAPSTGYSWLKSAKEDPSCAEKHPEFLEFMEVVTRASAEAEVRAVLVLQKAMGSDWRAAVEFLKRRYPTRWGDKQELSGNVDLNLNQTLRSIADDVRNRVIESMQKQDGAAATDSESEEDI